MDILLFFSLIFETVSLCNKPLFSRLPLFKNETKQTTDPNRFAPYTKDKGPVQWAEMITILNQAQSTH